ncbi:MAG: hypothetical protein AAFU79_34720, partial [Myxococcota bacterium]
AAARIIRHNPRLVEEPTVEVEVSPAAYQTTPTSTNRYTSVAGQPLLYDGRGNLYFDGRFFHEARIMANDPSGSFSLSLIK